jgi:hypothetical protein
LDCHDHGLPSQWFSRASVTHCPPLLLPGLPARPPSTSSKIIPCISREGSEQEPDRRPALCRSPSASSDRPFHFCPSGGSRAARAAFCRGHRLGRGLRSAIGPGNLGHSAWPPE